MERYIGLDAHATSCTFAVLSERGRRLDSAVVETNGRIAQSHQHSISAVLQTCPGMGLRTARQLWAYSGLAIVMRSSSDWVQTPHGWQRSQSIKTQGLNRNYNRRLKNIFKGVDAI
jgi:hypothetical protein